jgi:hypothetical protein
MNVSVIGNAFLTNHRTGATIKDGLIAIFDKLFWRLARLLFPTGISHSF